MREEHACLTPKGRFSPNTALRRYFPVICLLAVMASPAVHGQMNSVTEVREPSGVAKPSATGILNPQQVDGRFGSHVRGGYLSPLPFQNRFAGSGLAFTDDGAFLGVTESSSSRFGGSFSQSILPGEANLDLLEARQEDQAWSRFQAALDAAEARQRQLEAQLAAQQAAQRETQQSAIVEAFPEGAPQPASEPRAQEQIWMRGSAAASKNTAGAQNTPQVSGETDLQSRFVGGQLPSASPSQQNQPLPPAMFPPMADPRAETADQIQQQLQLLLLRSPQVNPLSPIEVTFQDGKATIQGVVPSQTHRLEAGRILLTDSRVKSVDNRLTVPPADTPLTPYSPQGSGDSSASDKTNPQTPSE